MKIGTIKSIWRYPAKGLSGERLQGGVVNDDGSNGDCI
jgi:uncharacterized protein YcbX